MIKRLTDYSRISLWYIVLNFDPRGIQKGFVGFRNLLFLLLKFLLRKTSLNSNIVFNCSRVLFSSSNSLKKILYIFYSFFIFQSFPLMTFLQSELPQLHFILYSEDSHIA